MLAVDAKSLDISAAVIGFGVVVAATVMVMVTVIVMVMPFNIQAVPLLVGWMVVRIRMRVA